MSAKFAVIALWAEDVPACAHFYHDVLGLSTVPYHGERPHFDVDGVYLTILRKRFKSHVASNFSMRRVLAI